MKTILILALLACAAPASAQVTLRFDYSGAEAMLEALERDSLSDAAIDTLLLLPGVQTILNTAKYFNPDATEAQFRDHLKSFVRTKTSVPAADRSWSLRLVWHTRHQVRPLLAELRANEKKLTDEALAPLRAYAPKTRPLDIVVQFIDGSSSGGGPIGTTGLYANLAQSQGYLTGQIANVAHESYHVLQNAAWREHPQRRIFVDSPQALPVGERLLATVLAEGTANFVVDPNRTDARGTAMDSSRARYARNATPERIAENFALFDRLLAELTAGRVSWQDMYRQGFNGNNDARFYFVGYEMAKAIEKYCGTKCIGELFNRPFADFFKQYISIYRAHPDIKGRFSPETEAFIAAQ